MNDQHTYEIKLRTTEKRGLKFHRFSRKVDSPRAIILREWFTALVDSIPDRLLEDNADPAELMEYLPSSVKLRALFQAIE